MYCTQVYRQPRLKIRNYKNGGHYSSIRLCIGNLPVNFSKFLKYCYYCGNKVYMPSVHRLLVCCGHCGRDLRSFRVRTPRSLSPYKTEGRCPRGFGPRIWFPRSKSDLVSPRGFGSPPPPYFRDIFIYKMLIRVSL